jgi:hypothetical protein
VRECERKRKGESESERGRGRRKKRERRGLVMRWEKGLQTCVCNWVCSCVFL